MAEMIPYVVRPGDYLTRIASLRGFDAKKVWDDPKNDELRSRRPNPEVLAAGDILHVPGGEPVRQKLKVAGKNAFTTKLPTVKIRLNVTDAHGQALANAKYWVDGEEAGTTDAAGKVEIEVPATRSSVALRVDGCPDTYLLRVASLDPVELPSGVRQRLLNLRYLPEDTALVTDAQVKEALVRFQRRHQLEPNGVADDATRARLVAEHGS